MPLFNEYYVLVLVKPILIISEKYLDFTGVPFPSKLNRMFCLNPFHLQQRFTFLASFIVQYNTDALFELDFVPRNHVLDNVIQTTHVLDISTDKRSALATGQFFSTVSGLSEFCQLLAVYQFLILYSLFAYFLGVTFFFF